MEEKGREEETWNGYERISEQKTAEYMGREQNNGEERRRENA